MIRKNHRPNPHFLRLKVCPAIFGLQNLLNRIVFSYREKSCTCKNTHSCILLKVQKVQPFQSAPFSQNSENEFKFGSVTQRDRVNSEKT